MILEAIDDSVLFASLATAVLGFSAIQRVIVRQRNPQQAQQPRWRRPDDAAPECAVCLNPPEYACELLCGHAFCISCFHEHWRASSRALAPASCPLCRSRATLLLERFSEAERGSDGAAAARQQLETYNRVVGTALPMRLLREAPHLARRLWQDPRHFARLLRSIRGALLLVALIAYVLSPMDLLPEAFLGVLGLADDALVVLVGAAIYLAQFREALR